LIDCKLALFVCHHIIIFKAGESPAIKLEGCIVLNKHNTVFTQSGLLYATDSFIISY